MNERKTYFISFDKERISEVSVPDTVEYEVNVTEDELNIFRTIMRENKHRNFLFATRNLLLKPFNEREVDEMRSEDDINLMRAFQFIYEYGTEETKQKLREMGYDPQLEDFKEY